MSKARITYRFDRDARNPDAEEPDVRLAEQHEDQAVSIGKVIPLYQEDAGYGARDYGAWKSPIDEETAKIERLIREAETIAQPADRPVAEPKAPARPWTGPEAPSRAEWSDAGALAPPRAHRQEQQRRTRESGAPLYYTADDADTSFAHIPFYEEPAASPALYRRARKRTNWLGMTTAVAGAVLTGILLGMFVLSMFQGEPLLKSAADTADRAAEEGFVVQPPSAGDSDDAGAGAIAEGDISAVGAAGMAAVQLPEQTFFFVQNGVFSGREGAALAASDLTDKGLAGAVEDGDMYSVFAGAAVDRDDALLLSQHLQHEGLDVFIKPYVLPATAQLPWSVSDSGKLRDYLMTSRELAGRMVTVSLQHINETSPSAISPDSLKQLKDTHQLWTTHANAVLEEAPAASKALLQAMNTAINSAMVSIEQYQKKPATAYMWQVQTAATEHLIGQKRLLSVGELL